MQDDANTEVTQAGFIKDLDHYLVPNTLSGL